MWTGSRWFALLYMRGIWYMGVYHMTIYHITLSPSYIGGVYELELLVVSVSVSNISSAFFLFWCPSSLHTLSLLFWPLTFFIWNLFFWILSQRLCAAARLPIQEPGVESNWDDIMDSVIPLLKSIDEVLVNATSGWWLFSPSLLLNQHTIHRGCTLTPKGVAWGLLQLSFFFIAGDFVWKCRICFKWGKKPVDTGPDGWSLVTVFILFF